MGRKKKTNKKGTVKSQPKRERFIMRLIGWGWSESKVRRDFE